MKYLGISLFGIGAIAAFGRLRSIEYAYNWLGSPDVGLSMPGAVGFMLIGVALKVIDARWRRDKRDE